MDVWILTERKHHRHTSFESAVAEKRRLEALNPSKRFYVVRCKTAPKQSMLYAELLAFAREIATRRGDVPSDLRRLAGDICERHDARQKAPVDFLEAPGVRAP